MKKGIIMMVGALLLLSSCGTYTESGATTGGWFGSIIGSAIGGITGGPRGSDIGSLVGMAGGAIVGAAIGQAADKAEQQKYEDYKASRQRRYEGDDRLYGIGEDFSTVEDVKGPKTQEVRHVPLEIRHARLLDASRDGVLTRGEEARMVFEIYNNSMQPVYRVQPSVAEVTGNRHIHISDNIMVESIPAGKGIRYTASIKADNRLRDGEIVIRIGVLQANREVTSQMQEFPIHTSRR